MILQRDIKITVENDFLLCGVIIKDSNIYVKDEKFENVRDAIIRLFEVLNIKIFIFTEKTKELIYLKGKLIQVIFNLIRDDCARNKISCQYYPIPDVKYRSQQSPLEILDTTNDPRIRLHVAINSESVYLLDCLFIQYYDENDLKNKKKEFCQLLHEKHERAILQIISDTEESLNILSNETEKILRDSIDSYINIYDKIEDILIGILSNSNIAERKNLTIRVLDFESEKEIKTYVLNTQQ